MSSGFKKRKYGPEEKICGEQLNRLYLDVEQSLANLNVGQQTINKTLVSNISRVSNAVTNYITENNTIVNSVLNDPFRYVKVESFLSAGQTLNNTNFDAAFRAACRSVINSGNPGVVAVPAGSWLITTNANSDPFSWGYTNGNLYIKGAGSSVTELRPAASIGTGSVLCFCPRPEQLDNTDGGGVIGLTIRGGQIGFDDGTYSAAAVGIRLETTHEFLLDDVSVLNFQNGRGIWNKGENVYNPAIGGITIAPLFKDVFVGFCDFGVSVNTINSAQWYNLRLYQCGTRSMVLSGGVDLKIFGGRIEAQQGGPGTSVVTTQDCCIELKPVYGGTTNLSWAGGYVETQYMNTGSVFRVNTSLHPDGYATGGGNLALKDWNVFLHDGVWFASASYANLAIENVYPSTSKFLFARAMADIRLTGQTGNGLIDIDPSSENVLFRTYSGSLALGSNLSIRGTFSAGFVSTLTGTAVGPGISPRNTELITPDHVFSWSSTSNEPIFKATSNASTNADDDYHPIAERPFDVDKDLGPYLAEYWDFSRQDLVQRNGTAVLYVTGALSGNLHVLTASSLGAVLSPTFVENNPDFGGYSTIRFDSHGASAHVTGSYLSWTGGPAGNQLSPSRVPNRGMYYAVLVGANNTPESGSGHILWTAGENELNMVRDPLAVVMGFITYKPATGSFFHQSYPETGSIPSLYEIGSFQQKWHQPDRGTTSFFNGEQGGGIFDDAMTYSEQIFIGMRPSQALGGSATFGGIWVFTEYPGEALMKRFRRYVSEKWNTTAMKSGLPPSFTPAVPDLTKLAGGTPFDTSNVHGWVPCEISGTRVYLPLFR